MAHTRKMEQARVAYFEFKTDKKGPFNWDRTPSVESDNSVFDCCNKVRVQPNKL